MNNSNKIKEVTLETAISFILEKGSKPSKRTARNICEVGLAIGGINISDEIQEGIIKELEVLLKLNDKDKLINYSLLTFLR